MCIFLTFNEKIVYIINVFWQSDKIRLILLRRTIPKSWLYLRFPFGLYFFKSRRKCNWYKRELHEIERSDAAKKRNENISRNNYKYEIESKKFKVNNTPPGTRNAKCAEQHERETFFLIHFTNIWFHAFNVVKQTLNVIRGDTKHKCQGLAKLSEIFKAVIHLAIEV